MMVNKVHMPFQSSLTSYSAFPLATRFTFQIHFQQFQGQESISSEKQTAIGKTFNSKEGEGNATGKSNQNQSANSYQLNQCSGQSMLVTRKCLLNLIAPHEALQTPGHPQLLCTCISHKKAA